MSNTRTRVFVFLATAVLLVLPCAVRDGFATTCYAYADADSSRSGQIGSICGGSYLDTHAQDGVDECLTEGLDSGSYKLSRVWDFNTVAAGSLTLTFTGNKTNCSGDDFPFGWNTDSNSSFFQWITGAVLNSCTGQTVTASVGGRATTGYVGLLLADSIVSGDSTQDTANIDFLKLTTSPTDTCPESESISPGSIISGSLSNVCAADSSYEDLEETLSGGHAKLKEVYTFDYVPTGNHTLCIQGYRTDGGGGDNFQFGFRTTPGSIYQVITGAVIDSSSVESGCYSFGSSSNTGEIYIAVWDTVGSDTGLNDLYLDQVVIHTDPICP